MRQARPPRIHQRGVSQGSECRGRYGARFSNLISVRRARNGYWHRKHQLPISLVCAEHGAKLIQFKVAKAKAHEVFFLPSDMDNHLRAASPENMHRPHDQWLQLAMLGEDALSDSSVAHPRCVVIRSFIVGMRERGLITSAGLLRKQLLIDSFEHAFGRLQMRRLLPPRDLVVSPKQLLSGIVDDRSCKPLSRLLLVYWLFGTWGAFKERCHWERILATNEYHEAASGSKHRPQRDTMEQHRAVSILAQQDVYANADEGLKTVKALVMYGQQSA